MVKDYDVEDLSLAEEGQRQIDWVAKWMSVLNLMAERFSGDGVLTGKRVAICVHLEAKTAYLAFTMKKLGVDVWITSSNPLSTKDSVAAALVEKGVHVYARHGATAEDSRSYIRAILAHKPHVVVDDGGDVCEYLHDHPEYGSELKGICEETTTGVSRLRQLAEQKRLLYPAIAINDARSKYLFDNRYGTGQSTWTAITHLTNRNVAGKTVVVIGYGWVGRGVAAYAKGMGAKVVVTEVDPWKALEASMDGFKVLPVQEAARIGTFLVTTTGGRNVLRKEHFEVMRDGSVLANAGHFDYEIDLKGLKEISVKTSGVQPQIDEVTLNNGSRIYLLAKGGIINIAGGSGHPVEIMDMSFSLQLGCVHHVLKSENLEPEVYGVPVEIDEMVVREKLKADGIQID